jgi:Uma2 family endonuclease
MPKRTPKAPALPPLENGDHLDQKTFHARYEAMPPGFRAELIGGIVYVSSPLKLPHNRHHNLMMRWLYAFEDETPGVESGNNVTAILGKDSEPQPDGCLLILPECGGQIREEDGWMIGAPEWIGEIAHSTEAIDLGRKKTDYEEAGVQEYVVIALKQAKVFWFHRRRGRFVEVPPDADGVYRSKVFPGLWFDPVALLKRDRKRLLAVLREGLATAEHGAFVRKLELRRRQP